MHEHDPNGLNPHTAGAKLDAGKTDFSLIGDFSSALTAVMDVATAGAIKYTPGGWLYVDGGIKRYTAAQLRHNFKEFAGESHDKDSGLLHAAHAAWNALARLELIIREREKPVKYTIDVSNSDRVDNTSFS